MDRQGFKPPPSDRAAFKASGIRTAFQGASFRRECCCFKGGLSESHRTRHGQGPLNPRWHHSLKKEGPARSSNPDQDGTKAAGTSSKTTGGEASGFLVQRLQHQPAPPGASEFPHSPLPRQTHQPRPFVQRAPILSEPPDFLSYPMAKEMGEGVTRNGITTTTPPPGVCMNPDTCFLLGHFLFVPHNSCVSQAGQELWSSLC